MNYQVAMDVGPT